MKILVINAGSSTYKFSLFDLEGSSISPPQDPTWTSILDYGTTEPPDIVERIQTILSPVLTTQTITIVGHRVVHGGDRFSQPVVVTPDVKQAIRELSGLAPLHNPVNLRGIEIMESLLPNAKQIAVFDTAFHRTMPASAATYALPERWRRLGIHRYGFHGISHSYCSRRAAALLGHTPQKLVSCHLGNGSSLTAVANGISVDTTMGLTPLEGVIMGSRSGSIDPGILLYLQREHQITSQELDRALNYESGYQGICGTADMREILQRKAVGDPAASLAYEMNTHSLRRNIGALAGVLGGMDTLLFTGGIGENAVDVRADVCRGLEFLGIRLDEKANASKELDVDVAEASSAVRVLVVHTREDLAIAHACWKLAQ